MTKRSAFNKHGQWQVLHQRQRSQRQEALVQDLMANKQAAFNRNLQLNRMQHELKKAQTLRRKETEKGAAFSYSNQSQSNCNTAIMKDRLRYPKTTSQR